MFTSVESAPTSNTVTCADNSSYPVKGVGTIVLTTTNGSAFTLKDALYILGIKKNLLSVYALTRVGLVVKFADDKCIAHDLNFGDTIVASGSLIHGIYKLNYYVECVEDVTSAASDLQAILDAKLWHACFGHLNFASLICLQKFEMVSLFSKT